MSNTRLTLTLVNEITEAIDNLLAGPVRFLEPPGKLATHTGRRELWNKLLPKEIQAMLTVGAQWDYHWPSIHTTGITMDVDGQRYGLIFGTEVDPLEPSTELVGYFSASRQIVDKHWYGKVHPHVENAEAFFGADYPAVLDWMRSAIADTIEAREARTVLVNDLLGMCKTAGQMKRMVPELLKYISPEKSAALHNQVRASSLPYDWAAYDRNAVDRAITYIAKCHMLTGLGKPFRQRMCRNPFATWVDPATVPVPRT